MGDESKPAAAAPVPSSEEPTAPAVPRPHQPRAAELARELAQALLEQDVLIVDKASLPPPPARPSLPVRAAQGGVKLTRLGLTVLGLVATLAEFLSRDHAVLRAVLRALWQSTDGP